MFAFTLSTPLPLHSVSRPCLTPLRRGPRPASRRAASVMVLSAKETAESPAAVRITGNNITITEALRTHINGKLGKVLRRFGSLLSKMDVHLTVEHNPSVANRHKAEVVAFAGKTILRTEVRSDDMYAAIDAVEDRIARTIRKYKERKEAKLKGKETLVPDVAGADGVDSSDDDSDDQFEDVYQDVVPPVPAVNAVVKKKVFPMPLQSVEEAVLCCEYVDHPWYLFRNAETGEISLVYKRNHGGYGLIEPSNPEVVDNEPV